MRTGPVPGRIVLIGIAIRNRARRGGEGKSGGGELVRSVIAEGKLGGRIAAGLPLPGGDVAVCQISVVELAQGAGWVGS